MAAAGAIAGLGIAGLSQLLRQDADPEKTLEQAILEMQEELVKFRQCVSQAVAAQKRTEKQYNDAQNEVNKWHRNAQLALQKGDEILARQALERKKTFNESSRALKVSLEQQTTQVDSLKRNLIQLESKISEAKTKKEMLKARATAAKAQELLQGMVRGMNTSSAMAAFERMEEKVLMQEARAQSSAELAGADLEAQFAKLEASSDVDDELAALKAQMLASSTQRALPQQSTTPNTNAGNNEVVDTELESLRKQLDNL
ncbi:hypothetical protein WA1_18985 [Scytonema hofmannii PCC 7110]|uniref:Phage shock protein A n=1 Tax=Scytonema hofmannii PCC 7110 TaxID=128403 RepID=A0A139XD48_9CYAN|nr:PspA/IM30 family protein [Scytonema hofmannii]KYC42583.1 hypothetical protein WA1_18985 [Scytonema hofmannii PCC 7110]